MKDNLPLETVFTELTESLGTKLQDTQETLAVTIND